MARTDEFEEFTKKGGRASGRVPMLRIRKSGKISLSKAAFDLLGQDMRWKSCTSLGANLC